MFTIHAGTDAVCWLFVKNWIINASKSGVGTDCWMLSSSSLLLLLLGILWKADGEDCVDWDDADDAVSVVQNDFIIGAGEVMSIVMD
jgi:hypothetical protein